MIAMIGTGDNGLYHHEKTKGRTALPPGPKLFIPLRILGGDEPVAVSIVPVIAVSVKTYESSMSTKS